MGKKSFGLLVKALRQERIHNGGSWTRKILSEKSGIPEATLGDIERGEKTNINIDDLQKLADVFELSTKERQGFFASAIGVSAEKMVVETKALNIVRDDVIRNLELINLPGFVIDSYCDIIAATSSIAQMLNISDDLIKKEPFRPGAYNLLRLVFSDEFNYRNMIGKSDWNEVAIRNIQLFRAITMQVRATSYFIESMNYLLENPSTKKMFRLYWHGNSGIEDTYSDNHHILNCEISYVSTSSSTLTVAGELITVIYIPTNDQTRDLFTALTGLVNRPKVIRLAPWPQKEY